MGYLMVLEAASELSFGIYFSSAKNRVRNALFSALGVAVLAFMFIRWSGVEEFWDLVRIIILAVSGGAVGAGIIGVSFLALVKGSKKNKEEAEK
jgi:hypothetical protein